MISLKNRSNPLLALLLTDCGPRFYLTILHYWALDKLATGDCRNAL